MQQMKWCCLQTAGGSGGISSVQVKGSDGDAGWTGLHNLYGSMWELDTQPQLPLDLHITADSGQEVGPFCGACPALLHKPFFVTHLPDFVAPFTS